MKKLMAILALAGLITTGCASSSEQKFVKTSYDTLATFAAAYAVEEPARETFCKGKTPQPSACVSAYEAAEIGWTAFNEASGLLVLYLQTKDQDVIDRLNALLPEIIASAKELTTVVKELK